MIKILFGKYFKLFFLIFISAFVLSYVGYNFNIVNQILFAVICLVTVVLSFYNLKFGLYIVLAELFVGSKGYLFWIEIEGTQVSLRLGLFLIVFAIWLYTFIKQRDSALIKSKLFKPLLLLSFFIVYGLVLGLIRGNSFDNLFFDINGYLYFGLAFVFFLVIRQKENINEILQILVAAILAVTFKSLLLVYIFGHQFVFTMPSLYRWVREFGIGEITMVTGNFYRVFFQGQIYALFLFFVGLGFIFGQDRLSAKDKKTWVIIITILITTTVIIVSYSRSFWLGLAGGLLFLIPLLFRPLRLTLAQVFKRGLIALVTVIIGVGLVFGAANFPFPQPGGTTSASLIKSRALEDLTSEAAAASRWKLLPILWDKIGDSPILGQGFGTTVTYKTEDPRFLDAHPDGLNTTFAFEWTYLDIWIKMGLFGLLSYLYLLWVVCRMGWSTIKDKRSEFRPLGLGLLAALVCLVVLNLTTPYLNHPLGIGFILLSGVIFSLAGHERSAEDVNNV
ncbi:MAG: O-antigen ligase family protein [Patescibacteria group bacterium]